MGGAVDGCESQEQPQHSGSTCKYRTREDDLNRRAGLSAEVESIPPKSTRDNHERKSKLTLTEHYYYCDRYCKPCLNFLPFFPSFISQMPCFGPSDNSSRIFPRSPFFLTLPPKPTPTF